jgi:hypothetical protein
MEINPVGRFGSWSRTLKLMKTQAVWRFTKPKQV